jgi:hypothetical protein
VRSIRLYSIWIPAKALQPRSSASVFDCATIQARAS